MKLTYVQFINPVSFGGQLQSASNKPVGDRPGQGAMAIELGSFEGARCVALTKTINGVPTTRMVPLTNVAMFEPAEPTTPALAPAVKK